jgi:hypothetical protein
VNQRPGDQQPPAHAAGKAVGSRARLGGQVEGFQQLVRPPAGAQAIEAEVATVVDEHVADCD